MDAPTLGVLRDTALLVWIALLFGVLAYQIMRVLLPEAITSIGRVQAGSYVSADAVLVAAISSLLLVGLRSAAAVAADAKPEVAELSFSGTLASIVIQLGICVGLLFGLRRMNVFKAFGMGLMLLVPTLMLVNGSALGLNAWMQGFWPDLQGQETVEAFRRSDDVLAKIMLVVAAAIVAPLVEEIIFRGFIYGVLKRYTDGIFAALCSSLLFAIVHLHVGTMFPLALLALVFCAVYEYTGCLLVPMVMHGLFNATSLVVMVFFPQVQP
jgi:uncharacterized protein